MNATHTPSAENTERGDGKWKPGPGGFGAGKRDQTGTDNCRGSGF